MPSLFFYLRKIDLFIAPIALGARRFARDEQGQATTEYILLLAASVTASVAMSKTILLGFNKAILTFGGELEKSLHTGRVGPANDLHGVRLWTN